MFRFISSIVLLSTLLYLGSSRIGSLPPLFNFLDPVHGVWISSNIEERSSTTLKPIEGLSDKVQIVYDSRQVPHIYAQSTEDVLIGLGYAVARDRLFQLELQTRATAGTLTEILGERVLPLDQQARQLGLAWAAEKNHSALDPTSESFRYQLAYAQGVNAWIRGMTASELPLEYHLLGQKPMEWHPQYSAYLLKRMGWTLSMKNTERKKNLASGLVGKDAANALFPVNSWIQEPMQPNGHQEPRFDLNPLPEPTDPYDEPGNSPSHLSLFTLPEQLDQNNFLETTLGSNNWAISPGRSNNGNPILAGDPHLNLSLPSIWYEAHLHVAGELEVYGVTIPGSPAINIGFNRNVAWTFTNTGSDVMDFYREEVDNPQDPQAYLLDNQWQALNQRVETYLDTEGSVIQVDTILHTHRGPVDEDSEVYTSLRWTVLEESGELDALIAIAKATSTDEWMSGMESWLAPTQNGLVIDRSGNIAIRSSGRYPIRPPDSNGDRIYDGSTSDSDWKGWLDVAKYPGAINPSQGYLTSSNQQPVDPVLYEYYLGSDWSPPWRAMRINQLLRSTPTLTLADLIRFQTDPGSARADIFVAAFLNAANTLSYVPNSSLQQAISLLSGWDRLYTKSNERAILFETAMNKLAENTWDELEDQEGQPIVRPGSTVLASLLQTPENIWWDERATADKQEDRDDILIKSLGQAIEIVKDEYGAESEGGWQWGKVQTANIYHLMNIPGLSALGIPVQGGPETLNPSSGSGRHGASWRMVVELGDSIIAKGIYPGGQSGNPLSPAYQNQLDDWSSGNLQELYFPKSIEEMLKSSTKVVELLPSRNP